jgi:hypothetical protein
MKTQEKMVELFKVEELQERMEFGEWTAEASGSTTQTPGQPQTTQIEASVSYTGSWSE